MKKNQSNRVIQQSAANLQHHPLAGRGSLTQNAGGGGVSKVAQSQELLPKFFQNNPSSLRQSSNFGKKKENELDSALLSYNNNASGPSHSLGDGQRFSTASGHNNNKQQLGVTGHQQHQQPSSSTQAVLNQAKSHVNIGGTTKHHQAPSSAQNGINSKSIDTATMKQQQRRLVQSGQKNMRQNVQQKHQRGTGQPLNQGMHVGSNQNSMQHSQANLSAGAGTLVKYNVKNGNFTFKAAGKNVTGGSGARADSRKLDSGRVPTAGNRNALHGSNVSSSVQVQSMRQLAAIGNSNNSAKGSANLIATKRSYAGNSASQTGGRKMSHSQHNGELFQSMGAESYQQKLAEDAHLKTASILNSNNNNNELGPLDISGGLKDHRGVRGKDERNKQQMLALNKKLIKPLTGIKNQNQSQQSLVFPGPQINSLMQGSSDGAILADSSRPSDRPQSSDKIPSLNFMTSGSQQQHQSQKIRIPKHALANVNKRNPADMSQKGSFVSQRSNNTGNQNNKSSSQQKHAKKNNQQLQMLHGHGGSNSQSSRFGGGQSTSAASASNNFSHSMSNQHHQLGQLTSQGTHLSLNQKLKSSANRENLTNADRRPMLTAITKPRFAANRYDESGSSATEPTIQAQGVATQNSGVSGKNYTLQAATTGMGDGTHKGIVNSERISIDRQGHRFADPQASQEQKDGFNTQKNEARSQSRTIGQFIPTQSTNSINNVSSNQHLQLSGTQQRAHVLKQSKSNISSKTIGLMQQRMLKTTSNNEQVATENLLKQAQYISSSKPSANNGLPPTVKVNPLLASADQANRDQAIGLPPMTNNNQGSATGLTNSKQFVRTRGTSNGQGNNMLMSSKNIQSVGGGPSSDLHMTPSATTEELKVGSQVSQTKRMAGKQRNPAIFSPESVHMTPYNDNQGISSEPKNQQLINDAKGSLKQFQSTPNSNNTTSVVLGSRDKGLNQINNDSMGANHTYRSENTRINEHPLNGNKKKIQKKLNNLLTQAQALQLEGQDENSPGLTDNQRQQPNSQRTPQVQSEKLQRANIDRVGAVGKHQNALSASQDNLSHLILPLQSSGNKLIPNLDGKQSQVDGNVQQIVQLQQELVQDQERERNDTIPEEPTISLDEFQSNNNQNSFTGNPMIDPSTGYNTGAPNSVQSSARQPAEPVVNKQMAGRGPTTQYIDSESIQKQQDGERGMKKNPEEPAGPASIKGLNRRRENKLQKSQNQIPSAKVTDSGIEPYGDATAKNNNQRQGGLQTHQNNALAQSQSSDKLQTKKKATKAFLNGEDGSDLNQQRPIMAKLSDRLQQNPMNLKSNEKSKLMNSVNNNKLYMNSNANQDDSHNNDDDDDFQDDNVAEENTRLEQVKSTINLNPKSQLHNSIAQRANRNQQIDQPGGDKNINNNRGLSSNNGANQQNTQLVASISSNHQQNATKKSQSAQNLQEQPQTAPAPQSVRKVEDHVAQFAYLTRPGKTADGVSKTNQDNFFVVKNFAKIENLWYFGVCDGHGQNGHYVSEYVKNKLALDVMEVDIAMKEQQALRLAKNKMLTCDTQDQKQNSSFESSDGLQQSTNSFYKRKQSHDGTGAYGNDLGDGINGSASRGKLGKKRKSQDDKAAELAKLKTQIMKQMMSNLLTNDQRLTKVFTEGFRKNDLGLKHQGFGFEFSGTTIVTAMVQGNRIVTANAGDSRTTIGALRSKHYKPSDPTIEGKAKSVEGNDKAWFSKMITRDHKPDDPDEEARILAMNGRIESYKGRYGENVGPARVWLKNEQYPGLAMSRSIGDACAHSVGVSALPEIKEFQTDDEDKFMILASDGVWEFLSNEEVIDMIVPFWHRNDLKGACSTVVKESVAAWEKEEDSIDDITCVIVFFKRSGPVTDYSQARASEQANNQPRRASNTRERESSQGHPSHSNNNGAGQNGASTSGGDAAGRQAKANQYQHKGRHLKKSKDSASQSSKK